MYTSKCALCVIHVTCLKLHVHNWSLYSKVQDLKTLEFSLALWTCSSQVLLALGKTYLVQLTGNWLDPLPVG